MTEIAERAAGAEARASRVARLRALTGPALFWLANLAVGGSTFVVLAFLSHRAAAGELAACAVVLGLVTVVAVVPGAVQLRSTAATAGGAAIARPPWRTAWGAGAALAVLAPALGALLSVPAAAVALVAVQLLLATALGASRGALIGRAALTVAGANFALEAAARMLLGAALGTVAGPTGLAAAVGLAAALALVHARGAVHGDSAPERTAAFAPAALSLGAIALLAYVDVLVARRALGPRAADAYAVAALPAKGIFFALFALSWLAAGWAVGVPRTARLLRPVAGTLGAGLLGALVLVVARPVLGPLLGRGVPPPGTLAPLGAAMAMAAATSVAMAMAVSRGARLPWIPAAAAAIAVAVAALTAATGATALAAVVLAGQALALAGTGAALWASGAMGAVAPTPVPSEAPVGPPDPPAASPPGEAPAEPATPAPAEPAPPAPVPRLALAAGSLLLLAGCLAQAPGRLVADTKLDLVVDPAGFLSRALHLWDAQAAFGQVQNQAAGYLFPMGPFFTAAHALGAPMWVAQRVWMALVLSAALWGAALVVRALGAGRPAGWVAAGGAYALSPLFVGTIASTSAGLLPAALAPWALLPLIGASRTGSIRRAAGRSGLAVLLMGGINAVSTGAVLLLPALWIATRPRSPRRTALAGWWLLAVALACAWWLGALAFQGRYGLDFLRFTETPAVTEATTSALATLRGASAWLAYLRLGDPWLPAGWALGTAPALILATTAVAAAGLAGLALARPVPERRFLVVSAAVGAICVAAGFSGPAGGLLGGPVRDALGGALSPLRNVAKFDPVLRLPLAVGLAHLLACVRAPRWRTAAVAAAGAAVVAGAWPVLNGTLAPRGAFRAIPSYWRQTADYLAARSPDAGALLVPAAPFGEYRWGRPMDEPLQPLARSPWAVRNLIPLGGVGSTRVLDVVEHRLVTGRPAPRLRRLLARDGVRFVVARNDLDWRRSGAPRPIQVHDVLVASGLRRVAAFGPRIAASRPADAVADLGLARQEARLPAVEIFATRTATGLVAAPPQAGTPVVSGGPDAVAQLVARHVAPGHVAVLAADRPSGLAAAPWFVGDALRRRATDFGLVHDAGSYTLAPGERAAGEPGPIRQLLPRDQPAAPAVARVDGLRAVSASSYGSWLLQLPEVRPDNAFDGDPATSWVAGQPRGSTGAWVQADLVRPVPVSTLRVRLLADGPWRVRVRALRVTTDVGSRVDAVHPTEAVQTIRTVPGVTRHLRIAFARLSGDRRGAAPPGLRDIGIPGVRAQRVVVVPQEPALLRASGASGHPPEIAFDRLSADPADPLRRDEEPALLRAFRLAAPARMLVSGAVRPRPGPALDALLTTTRGVRAQASSTWNRLPRWRAANAVDGSRQTSWIAAPPAPPQPQGVGSAARSAFLRGGSAQRVSPVPAEVDPRPALLLRWRGPRTLSRVRVLPAGVPAATPLALRLASPAGVRVVTLRGRRMTPFPPVRTDRLVVTFPRVQRRFTTTTGGRRVALPVGLRELDLPALRRLRVVAPPPAAPLRLPCGAGPSLWVAGRRLATRLSTTSGAAVALRSAQLHVCGDAGGTRGIGLGAGITEVRTDTAGAFGIDALTLRGADPPPAATARARAVHVLGWTDAARRVRVGSGPAAFLAVRENYNTGWHATLHGRSLRAIRLDGWEQGFAVPAGAAGTVTLRYAPDHPFRLALAGGALLAALLLALALVPARRRTAPVAASRSAAAAAAPASHAAVAGAGALVLAALAIALVSVPALAVVPLLGLLAWRRPALGAAAAALLLIAAGVVAVAQADPAPGDHAGAFGSAAQILAAAAFAAVLLSTAVPARPGSRPPPPPDPRSD